MQHQVGLERVVGFPKHFIVNHHQRVGSYNEFTFGDVDRSRLGHGNVQRPRRGVAQQISAFVDIRRGGAPANAE
jgi:hypothetical protein